MQAKEKQDYSLISICMHKMILKYNSDIRILFLKLVFNFFIIFPAA